MVLLTTVYSQSWYHSLNYLVLQFHEDILATPRFPAVVLLQDIGVNTQANLVDLKAPKCFIGEFNDEAPACETLSAEQYLTHLSCNCNSSLSSNLEGSFLWATSVFKYYLFMPPPYLISKNPGYHVTLQASFNYNASATISNSSIRPSPNLQVAVFDPAFSSIEQALDSGYSPLNLFNANGISYINLNLNLYQSINVAPVYYYDPSISTSPNTNIVCDTGANKTELCFVYLEIQYTSHDRSVTVQKRAMAWTDAAVSAGAYFAFVQFMSWIVSGQVWAT